MKPALPFFLLGLGIGVTGAWFVPHLLHDSAFKIQNLPAPRAPGFSAWSWREQALPPPLSTDAVGPALVAWRALREADGSPASFATRAAALRAIVVRLPAEGFPRLLAPFASASTEAEKRLRLIAFSAWTDLDPAAAAAWACALPDAEAARALCVPALIALAAKDLARAIALAESRDAAFRSAVLPALLDRLCEADPAAAVRNLAASLWKNGAGFYDLRGPLAAWVRLDPDGAIRWLAAQPGRMSAAELARTPEERRAVASIYAAHPEYPRREEALAELIPKWARGKPAEVLAWLDQLADPKLRLSLLQTAAGYRNFKTPDQRLPFVLALPESQSRTERLGETLSEWGKTDRPAALAWIAAHDDPAVTVASYQMQADLLSSIARDEPATALAEWGALADPRAKKASLAAIVQAWGKTDPAAALQWGSEQQRALSGETRLAADLNPLLRAWTRQDPDAALRWVEARTLEQSAGAHPEHSLLRSYAQSWEYKDMDSSFAAPNFAEGAALFSKIQDPALREDTLTYYLRRWNAKDPAAARAWLDTHDALTPAQAATILAHQ